MSGQTPRSGNDTALNLGLGLIAMLGVLAGLLRVAGTVAAWLTDTRQPAGNIGAGLGVLAHPTRPASALRAPGLSPVAYWAVVAGLLAGAGLVAWLVVRVVRSHGDSRDDPRRRAGLATTAQVRKVASGRALRRRAATLRPSLHKPAPSEVGYLLGHAKGQQVWASVEDSMLLIGPPRSGKGLHVVINAILAAGTGLGGGGVEGGGFWEGKTAAAIQALLHAAALDGRDARTLYQWALNPTGATDAVLVLQSDSRAAEGWADSLGSMIDSDPRTRDSIWQGVGLAFNALADPRVLDAVTPREGEGFDPDAFLREQGTLYLLATGAGAGASAALVSAFIEDVTETARRHAARSPGARLDPPLLLALDEIASLAPLPSLPTLMSDGGGTGITTLTVLQSMAQARQKWGENQAAAISDTAIVKVILGGESNSRDLQDLSTLIGERDETTDSTTTDATGGRSHQRSIRRVPILPPDALRTMPFGLGTILLRAAPPIVTDLRPWTGRTDADQLTTDRRQIEQTLRAAA